MPTTIDNLLSRMTLEEKIGQMILASIEVSRMDAGTREFLRKNHIGNVILFGKNCAGRAALAQLNAEIQHTVMAENGLPALIAIDQEGGCVTRLRSEATVFPSAMVIARTGDPANAYKVGRMMGGELRALGINLDCAPVLDTLSGPAERRYYGQTVQSIADYGWGHTPARRGGRGAPGMTTRPPGCWPAANISPAMSRPVPIHTSALWWTIPRVTH